MIDYNQLAVGIAMKKSLILSLISILLLSLISNTISATIEFTITSAINENSMIDPFSDNNSNIYKGFLYIPLKISTQEDQSQYGQTTPDEDLILSKNKTIINQTGVQVPISLSKYSKYFIGGGIFLFMLIIICGYFILIVGKKKKEEDECKEEPVKMEKKAQEQPNIFS